MLAPPATLTFFFFNDTATTEIYTLSLHDALPISRTSNRSGWDMRIHFPRRTLMDNICAQMPVPCLLQSAHYWVIAPIIAEDRKSTRLNSSHTVISYAVFCLKKKNKDRLQLIG